MRRRLAVAAAALLVCVLAIVALSGERGAGSRADVAPPEAADSIETTIPPAASVQMLGSVAGGLPGETWAIGISSAPPASVDGTALPYAAEGSQLVLMRYTDDGGWQIRDVPRASDGVSGYPVTTNADGQMLGTGEGWLLAGSTAPGDPGLALFHRAPGGAFVAVDPSTLDPSVAALIESPNAANVSPGALHVAVAPDGTHLAATIGQAPVSVPLPPIVVHGRDKKQSYQTVLQFLEQPAGGPWQVSTIAGPGGTGLPPLPAGITLADGEQLGINSLDVAGDSVWATLRYDSNTARPPLLLERRVGPDWAYVPTGLDVLDLTGTNGAAVRQVIPGPIVADSGGLWISATVNTADGSGQLIARYDLAAGAVTSSWCTLPGIADACSHPLDETDNAAALPFATFTDASGAVALGYADNSLRVFRNGTWTRYTAPGFNANTPTFSSSTDGWLVGDHALGHWTTTPRPSELTTWPQANRSTLLSVALPPGSQGAYSTAAVAVGLSGTAEHYEPGTGWLVDGMPPSLSSLNLLGVAYRTPTDAVAVGQRGAIVHTDGSGTWTADPQSNSQQEQLNAVAFNPSGTDGYAVGVGVILHDAGGTWTPVTPPVAVGGFSIDFTAVAYSGPDVFAIGNGDLYKLQPDGSWALATADLPSSPPVQEGSLRVLATVPDGGIVAAGRRVILQRDAPGQPWTYGTQPIEGIAVAAAAFRGPDGVLRSLISLAPAVTDPDTGLSDTVATPPGDGELLRQTVNGWDDVQRSQYPGSTLPTDGAPKTDPVLAVAASPDGLRGWAVGGYAGGISASGLGSSDILAARAPGWQTASVWRFDFDGASQPPPNLAQVAAPSLPVVPGHVGFAYLSDSSCIQQCTAAVDAQPDVNLAGVASQVDIYSAQPGGPAFALFGGDLRGPSDLASRANGQGGAVDLLDAGSLLAPFGSLPVYAAYGTLDPVPTAPDPAAPWSAVFANAPAPFGGGAAPAGVTPVGSGPLVDGVHRYYSFDTARNGGTLRSIVLDNSAGSLEQSEPGQTAWLQQQLQLAQAANVPVVVFAARPLRSFSVISATDGPDVAHLLAQYDVSAVFTTQGSAGLDESYTLPEDADPSAQATFPEFEGANIGYQLSANGGVLWYLADIDTNVADRTQFGTAPVTVQAIPLVTSLALRPLDGLSVPRSSTLRFTGLGRRPQGSLAPTLANSSAIGVDNYAALPAAGCSGRPCLTPAYSFTSSDPTIGYFVQTSGPGSRYPKLDANDQPIASSSSGLFCAFNSGTTTVTISAGGLQASQLVTVQAGGFGPPCGTVPKAGVGGTVVVQSSSANPTTPPAPPPVAPVAKNLIPKITVPQPPPAPIVTPVVKAAPVKPPAPAAKPAPPAPAPPAPAPSPAPAPVPVPAANTHVLQAAPLLPPPPAQPVPPPSSGTAQSPVGARKKEEARKSAQQGAFTLRPSGSSTEAWLLGAAGLGAVSLSIMLALAVSASTPRRRTQPARAAVMRASGRNQ